MPRHTSITDAAASVGRSPSAISQAIRNGHIQAYTRFKGDQRAVDLDEVKAYFAKARRGRPKKIPESS